MTPGLAALFTMTDRQYRMPAGPRVEPGKLLADVFNGSRRRRHTSCMAQPEKVLLYADLGRGAKLTWLTAV